ncbi:hypothetical protein FACS189468_0610 [Spirochaetia bacterium]|nr:hypothetical protein FACS189468_0610 [Spirochaetia bacterium]
MKKVVSIVFAVCILLSLAGCSKENTYSPETDPANPENVIPTTGDETNTATIWEVPTPEPRLVKGELMYSLPYGNEVASTRNKSEWESWLQDPSRAPLPQLRGNMAFVLDWCHQFAQYEPEDVALILMNYFEYDHTFTHMQPVWYWSDYPGRTFLDWRQLRRAILDKTLVCAGYAQLFYLIVREKYPDVKYIQSNQLNHARNYFEDEHWDITWLDDAGVDYNPDKIKFDFVGMQKRINRGLKGNVGSDWKMANIIIGEHP